MTQPPRATERIFLSAPSLFPPMLAVGIASVVIGIYAWWPYSIVGAVIALISLVGWLRTNRDEIARMPTRQPTETAPIPLSGRE